MGAKGLRRKIIGEPLAEPFQSGLDHLLLRDLLLPINEAMVRFTRCLIEQHRITVRCHFGSSRAVSYMPVHARKAGRYADDMLRQTTTALTFEAPTRGLHEITRPVAAWVERSGIADGLLTLFVRHTSASLVIQENADPDVRQDLDRFFARLVPDGDPLFKHRS